MAGLYIHVPFCKKVCSYCDFYKTTATSLITEYLAALNTEMADNASYLDGDVLETIYIGGGTPSLIRVTELEELFIHISENFNLAPDCEITFNTGI